MKVKEVSGIMLTLLLISMLTLTFNIQTVRAEGTIYIRPDGTVDPPTAPIQRHGDVYTFTNNIYCSIVVERDNIVVDGAGYALQGTGGGIGIYLSHRNYVTIKNMGIKEFNYGIYFSYSLNNSISRNSITNNARGIWLDWLSNYNNISGNNITNNNRCGIVLVCYSNYNSISGNNITNNTFIGVCLEWCSDYNTIYGNIVKNHEDFGIGLFGEAHYNIIYGNNITNNDWGIVLDLARKNKIYHNNFINNNRQVYAWESSWDNGYPSGGNYWSDYDGVDLYSGPHQNITGSDGIGDTPYVKDVYFDLKDNYPFMNPWTPENAIEKLIRDVENMNLQQGIDNSLDAKLTAVLGALEALNVDQRNDAINKLYAFINEVEAQREKKLTNEQADYLIAAAQEIISLID